MGQVIEQKQRNYIKKHVATIHCSNTLSLLQRKISNALLYYAYPNLEQTEEHGITVKQLCNIIRYYGNNHKVIKEALEGLLTTVIEWNLTCQETGEEDWTASTILASVRIKGALCQYSYSPRMRALLYSPQIYGKINLIIQARFNSSYGLALYENCMRYKDLDYTKWFDIETFRKLMGVPTGTYLIFRDFKKRVVDKSVEEVNTYSDLIVEPEIKRSGHTVTSIRFKLKDREKKKRLGINEGEEGRAEEDTLTKKLKQNFGLTSKQVVDLLEVYEKEFIVSKIKLIEDSNSYKDQKIDNLAAYLLSALKHDYQLASSNKEAVQEKIKEKALFIEEKQAEEEEKRLKRQYEDYLMSITNTVINNFSRGQLEQLKNEFAKRLEVGNNIFVLKKYQVHELDNNIVKILFRNFLKEKYPHLISYSTYDDYKKLLTDV